MKIIKFLTSLLLIVFLSSCALQYLDAPSPSEEDSWIKKGLSKNDIVFYLEKCGHKESTWNMQQQEKTDKCMLSHKFIFIDSPYGETGSICKFLEYKNLPSCKSLNSK